MFTASFFFFFLFFLFVCPELQMQLNSGSVRPQMPQLCPCFGLCVCVSLSERVSEKGEDWTPNFGWTLGASRMLAIKSHHTVCPTERKTVYSPLLYSLLSLLSVSLVTRVLCVLSSCRAYRSILRPVIVFAACWLG